jgi:hypothetical protein
MNKVQATITSSRGILHLAENSRGREYSIDIDILEDALDPAGRNLLYYSEPLEEGIIRTQWFVALKESHAPEPIWLDIDITAMNEVGTIVELEVPEKKEIGEKRSFAKGDKIND